MLHTAAARHGRCTSLHVDALRAMREMRETRVHATVTDVYTCETIHASGSAACTSLSSARLGAGHGAVGWRRRARTRSVLRARRSVVDIRLQPLPVMSSACTCCVAPWCAHPMRGAVREKCPLCRVRALVSCVESGVRVGTSGAMAVSERERAL